MRFQIPALILVDADSENEAHEKALALGATLDKNEGPGAFFTGITVAAVALPERKPDREDEDLPGHAESLQMAAGLQ